MKPPGDGWVSGPAFEVMRAIAGYMHGAPSEEFAGSGGLAPPNNGVFRAGDEVWVELPPYPSESSFVGVLVVNRHASSGREGLRVRKPPAYDQWRWWRNVTAWRRPCPTKDG